MSSPTYPQPLEPVVPLDAEGDWGPLALYTNAGEALAHSSSSSDDAVLGRPGEVGGPRLRTGVDGEHWSPTTYSGPRRHRPAREPSDVPAESSGPSPLPPPPDRASPSDLTSSPEPASDSPTSDQPMSDLAVSDLATPDPPVRSDHVRAGCVGPNHTHLDSAHPDSAHPRLRPRSEQATAASSASPETPAGEATAGTADRGLLSSSRTMAVASLASRITGFLRTLALVAALGIGATKVADAYNVANTLPNMVYTLLIGGVLSSVIIPLIVHAQEHDPDRGESYTQRLLTWGTVGLAIVTTVAVVAAPWISGIFPAPRAERDLITIFATLLLPEIFFYGLGALYTAVLNTRGVYGPPAWASVLNNVVTIATVAVFALLPGPALLTESSITTGQILVLGIGTTLGIVAQALVLIPYLKRSGFRWKWRFRASASETVPMSEVRTLAGWVLGYVAFSQIGVYVINRVAIGHKGGVSTFTYGDLLFQMPYGIIAVSLLTALMPRMSRSAARDDAAGVVADLSLGARLSAVGLVPITGFLMVLAPTMVTVIFSYGRSDASDGRTVGVLLALGAFGLLPFAIVMLQLRVFYAMRDTRTPTLINAFMVGTKVLLALVFAAVLHGDRVVIWLEFVTSASYLIGAVVGHVLLSRRFGRLGFGEVARTTARIGAVTAAGALVALGVLLVAEPMVGRGPAGSAATLVVATVAGGAVLVGLLRVVRVAEVDQMLASLRRSRS